MAIIKDETLASRKTADWVCFGGKSWKTNSRWPKIVDKRLNMTYERIQKRNLQESVMTFSPVFVLNVVPSRTFETKIFKGRTGVDTV